MFWFLANIHIIVVNRFLFTQRKLSISINWQKHTWELWWIAYSSNAQCQVASYYEGCIDLYSRRSGTLLETASRRILASRRTSPPTSNLGNRQSSTLTQDKHSRTSYFLIRLLRSEPVLYLCCLFSNWPNLLSIYKIYKCSVVSNRTKRLIFNYMNLENRVVVLIEA